MLKVTSLNRLVLPLYYVSLVLRSTLQQHFPFELECYA